ncbi:uncharacterized protein LOC128254232 isoform X1 [Drosophila gunungcola]|uniref:uncharacterized protein LOC128254232 isoform X1 n=1 Tax=Drosophila gunungcola TaxID=103775 RepID=UPI0022E28E53|nr:uncharacterized protein LOC128254232 isoform X1 [Drosophila gunungcola]
MKLTVLFIVLQLFFLLAIRANDLSQDQQDMAASMQALQRHLAHPWNTPCIRNCLEEKNILGDRPSECQQVEQQFDCTLHCIFQVEPLNLSMNTHSRESRRPEVQTFETSIIYDRNECG